MTYQCSKCNTEFEVEVVEHPHSMYSSIRYGAFGCPVCLKAAAMPKVCPKCGSIETNQKINFGG
jgi:ssDNA-binding Zn-finger/Zn-ribbon topoisomerase 1